MGEYRAWSFKSAKEKLACCVTVKQRLEYTNNYVQKFRILLDSFSTQCKNVACCVDRSCLPENVHRVRRTSRDFSPNKITLFTVRKPLQEILRRGALGVLYFL